jgi:hypothetical protein
LGRPHRTPIPQEVRARGDTSWTSGEVPPGSCPGFGKLQPSNVASVSASGSDTLPISDGSTGGHDDCRPPGLRNSGGVRYGIYGYADPAGPPEYWRGYTMSLPP